MEVNSDLYPLLALYLNCHCCRNQNTDFIIRGGNFMKKFSGIELLGLAATIFGVGATILANVVHDKKMDLAIEEKVIKALTEKQE
jgi:hypothetical protein